MYIPRLDNTAVQHWLLWVIGSPVKWDRSYWSMGSHHYKDDMKWWTQALKNQSSPKSLPPLDDAAMDHLQPPGICKPRGSSKPSQSSCAVLGSSVHESQASSDPTIDSCLIHWAMPHQVLPCAGHQDCRSLQSFWHLAPQGWHLDSSVTAPSLPIMTVTFLTDVENSLLKIFLAEKTDYFLVLTCSTYYDMQ